MLRRLKRALLRMQIRDLELEAASLEHAAEAIEARREEVASKEIELRRQLGNLLPLCRERIWRPTA